MRSAVVMRTLLCMIAIATVAAGQTTSPTFIQTYEVRVSNVDVVVTDKSGGHVRGLKQEDFEVVEGGTPQPITNFAEYSSSSGVATSPARPQSAEAIAANAPPPRRFVFFVDEMALHPRTRGKLLDSGLQLVNSMRPDDQATVITPATADKVSLPFTSDTEAIRAALRAAFESTGFRANTRSSSEAMFFQGQVVRAGDKRERREAARRYAMIVNQRVSSTLASLRALVATLAPLPGRKVIVAMSASLSAEPGREAFTLSGVLETGEGASPPPLGLATDGALAPAVPDAFGKPMWFDARGVITEIGALAAASGITIYSLQPELGISVGTGGGADQTGRRAVGQSSVSAISQYQREILDGTRFTLGTLADTTGGKYFIGDREIAGAFEQVTNDLQSYYSIGYRPSNTSSDALRSVVVHVKGRPELTVRSKRQIMRESPKRAMNDLAASTLLFARDVDELKIQAAASSPVAVDRMYRVDVIVQVPIGNLTFVPQGDKHRAQFTVHYAAAGSDTSFSTGIDREQLLEVSDADFEQARTRLFTYKSSLMVSRGTTRIAVAVHDPISRQSSFKTLTVNAR